MLEPVAFGDVRRGAADWRPAIADGVSGSGPTTSRCAASRATTRRCARGSSSSRASCRPSAPGQSHRRARGGARPAAEPRRADAGGARHRRQSVARGADRHDRSRRARRRRAEHGGDRRRAASSAASSAGRRRRAALVQLLIDRVRRRGALLEKSGERRHRGRRAGRRPAAPRAGLAARRRSQLGERVLTSGQDGIYPAGLPDRHGRGGRAAAARTAEIAVRPAVDFSHIDVVLVVLDRRPTGRDQ